MRFFKNIKFTFMLVFNPRYFNNRYEGTNSRAFTIIRKNLYNSLFVVLIGVIIGYFLRIIVFTLLSTNVKQTLQYIGAGILLWGTIFYRLPIGYHTVVGSKDHEKLERFIYDSLYIIGTIFVVISL